MKLSQWRKPPMGFDPLLIGVYVWLLTAAAPTVQRPTIASVLLSGAAVVALVSGWIAVSRSRHLMAGFGLVGFVVFCAGAMISLPTARGAPGLFDMSLGAFSWLLFGLAWMRAYTELAIRDLPVPTSSPFAPIPTSRSVQIAQWANVAGAVVCLGLLVWFSLRRSTFIVGLTALLSFRLLIWLSIRCFPDRRTPERSPS